MKCCIFFLSFISTIINLHAFEVKTIHVEGELSRGTWMDFSSSTELNLKKLFDLLSRSKTGEKLIKEAAFKASRSGLLMSDVVKVGEGSLTDTTLVRKFSPHNPQHVIYESRSVVFINRHLAWDDALLDLAHELTHYIYRGSFNPYSDEFNPKDFIKSTIEGEGGEVQAFITECQVLKELFSTKMRSRSHCQKIENAEGQASFSKAVELFYFVGPYYSRFGQSLKERKIESFFPHVKSEKVNFISSAYGVPYPVAALMEYDLVLAKVCENDKKRLAYMQQGPSRTIASENPGQDKFIQSYFGRCPQK